MKKKLLGILLSLGLVLTMIPATVFADSVVYTLSLPGAKSVFALEGKSAAKDRTWASGEWEESYAPALLTDAGKTTVGKDTWSEAYPVLESEISGGKFSGTDGNFSENDSYGITVSWLLLSLNTDGLSPGASYVVYYATSEVGVGTITIDPTPIASGKLMSDEPASTKTSSDTATSEGNVTENVTVDYTYLHESNTAEKVFNVTIDYKFPATLDAKGAQNTYTWDATNGKYTKDELEDANKESYVLSNEGAFEITVTNKSNVDISYEVSYAANASAVFASALNGYMTNDKATLATVAQGQEVTTDGINITNATNATAAMADGDTFNSETCSGKLKVSGINTNKTPEATGTDKLGTFTISIAETEVATFSTVQDVLDTVDDGFPDDLDYAWEIRDEAFCLIMEGNLIFGGQQSTSDTVALNKALTTCTNGYCCESDNGATITFYMVNNKLAAIIVSGESGNNSNLNGEYYPPSIVTEEIKKH